MLTNPSSPKHSGCPQHPLQHERGTQGMQLTGEHTFNWNRDGKRHLPGAKSTPRMCQIAHSPSSTQSMSAGAGKGEKRGTPGKHNCWAGRCPERGQAQPVCCVNKIKAAVRVCSRVCSTAPSSSSHLCGGIQLEIWGSFP